MISGTSRSTLALLSLLAASCGGKKAAVTSDAGAAPTAVASAVGTPTPTTPAPPAATASGAAAVVVPAGSPPPDGKYERVKVDGVTVPMVQVMNSGAIVLVDTDGKKPRSWEEQYKRKRNLPNGAYDLHKTNTNGNDTFEDDAIDKEGTWVIDAQGNITKQ